MFKARRIAKMHPSLVRALVNILVLLGRELVKGKDVDFTPAESTMVEGTPWAKKGLRLFRREYDATPDDAEPAKRSESPKAKAKPAAETAATTG
jgi:hypothetical protein